MVQPECRKGVARTREHAPLDSTPHVVFHGLGRYGFVRFSTKEEAAAALAMHGEMCGSSRLRVVEATGARNGGGPSAPASRPSAVSGADPSTDPTNTMLFVGGIDSNTVSADDLTALFGPFGAVCGWL